MALPQWTQTNVHYVPTRWPHKLLNVLTALTGAPKLDRLVANQTGVRLDCFFSPNLHFTALTKNIPHILMVHDLTFHLFKNYYTPRQRLWHRLVAPKTQCQKAKIIIVPSANTKRDIVEYYQIDQKKITVLSPGLNSQFKIMNNEQLTTNKTKIKYSLPDNYILFLGTIEPRKNILGLITAFEQFTTTTYQLQAITYSLVIAGAPGWKNHAILKRIHRSPVKDKIKLIGYVDPADKPALYRGASLFIYPSFYEGFGFPALEAMAAGVPVITSNRSSLPEVTSSAAYLINPHRPDEIAEGMKYLLNNQTAREQAIKKGLERAKTFSWERTAKDALTLFHSI